MVGDNFTLTDLDYADDMCILVENVAGVQSTVNEKQSFASQVNAAKTQILMTLHLLRSY